jgi:hypothetical protein
MKIAIGEASALGVVVRPTRKTLELRQDDAAGSIGVNENLPGITGVPFAHLPMAGFGGGGLLGAPWELPLQVQAVATSIKTG